VQGPWKYRRASEFLVNTAIGGIKGVVGRIIGERDGALRKVAEGEAHIAQVGVVALRLWVPYADDGVICMRASLISCCMATSLQRARRTSRASRIINMRPGDTPF
jgi:hypothetical protein